MLEKPTKRTLDRGRAQAQRLYPAPLGPCEHCGARPARERHHVDGDTFNNARSNVWFLCNRCHQAVDGRARLLREWGARGLAKTAALRRARTHCRAGHEYTPENTMIRTDGVRLCLTCRHAIEKRSRDRPRP